MIDFEKGNGLVPCIIQDNTTLEALMLGYMNEAAYNKTIEEKRVTFFSRSKNRLWTKGETTGNYLNLVDIKTDCDNDALLVFVNPIGPTCHTGEKTCFGASNKGFIYQLEKIIETKINNKEENSYTNSLVKKGIQKVAQKVGEEAVEVVIEAMQQNNDVELLNESADLVYHLLVLLKARMEDDCQELICVGLNANKAAYKPFECFQIFPLES
jgi:phosphoribosyl-AMP cyclohydrolase / phosphoribosyl-ATP pyrophosphohydrolase